MYGTRRAPCGPGGTGTALREARSLTGMVGALVRITVILAIAAGLTALGELRRRRFGRTRYEGPPLDAYETAYLAGSTPRVALVATLAWFSSVERSGAGSA